MKNDMISSMYKNYKKLLQNRTTMYKAELSLTKNGHSSYPAFLWQEIVNNESYIYISMLGFINAMKDDGKLSKIDTYAKKIKSRIKEEYLAENFLPESISNAIKANDIDLDAIEKDADKHVTQLELQRNFVNAYLKGVEYYVAVSDKDKQQLEVIKTFLNIDATLQNQASRHKADLFKTELEYSMDDKKIKSKELSIDLYNKKHYRNPAEINERG